MNDTIKILEKLKETLKNSYSPYSRFRVAALVKSGTKEFYGVNLENISYSLTICAEASAISSAVTNGIKKIDELYLVSDSEGFIYPCGACRQIISEFSDHETTIYVSNAENEYLTYKIEELLPNSFSIKTGGSDE